MVIIILPTAFRTKSTPAVFPVHTIPFLSFSTPFFGRENPYVVLCSEKQFSTWTSNPLKQRMQEKYQGKDFLLLVSSKRSLQTFCWDLASSYFPKASQCPRGGWELGIFPHLTRNTRELFGCGSSQFHFSSCRAFLWSRWECLPYRDQRKERSSTLWLPLKFRVQVCSPANCRSTVNNWNNQLA